MRTYIKVMLMNILLFLLVFYDIETDIQLYLQYSTGDSDSRPLLADSYQLTKENSHLKDLASIHSNYWEQNLMKSLKELGGLDMIRNKSIAFAIGKLQKEKSYRCKLTHCQCKAIDCTQRNSSRSVKFLAYGGHADSCKVNNTPIIEKMLLKNEKVYVVDKDFVEELQNKKEILCTSGRFGQVDIVCPGNIECQNVHPWFARATLAFVFLPGLPLLVFNYITNRKQLSKCILLSLLCVLSPVTILIVKFIQIFNHNKNILEKSVYLSIAEYQFESILQLSLQLYIVTTSQLPATTAQVRSILFSLATALVSDWMQSVKFVETCMNIEYKRKAYIILEILTFWTVFGFRIAAFVQVVICFQVLGIISIISCSFLLVLSVSFYYRDFSNTWKYIVLSTFSLGISFHRRRLRWIILMYWLVIYISFLILIVIFLSLKFDDNSFNGDFHGSFGVFGIFFGYHTDRLVTIPFAFATMILGLLNIPLVYYTFDVTLNTDILWS